MSVAPDGTLYAMQRGATISRFDPGARGDASPAAVFCFTHKKTEHVFGFAASNGEVDVLAYGSLSAFARTSSGLVDPLRYIGDAQYGAEGKPGIKDGWGSDAPFQITVGSEGTDYILKDTSCRCHAGGSQTDILMFSPKANGTVSPDRDIVPLDPAAKDNTYAEAIALDSRSRLFFLDASGDLVVSRPGAIKPYAREAHLPLAKQAGPDNVLAVTNAGTAYVGDGSVVLVVTGATGAAPAVKRIGGARTRVTRVDGLATDASGKLYVENCAHGVASILVFKPGSIGNIEPSYALGGPHTNLGCSE
jgi:hypothetical protein